jgi:energy-coupling factor transporter ATP-binding protein EcfA2
MHKRSKRMTKRVLTQVAMKALRHPGFLFELSGCLRDLGIVGETRNRLVIFLAALSTRFEEPVSVLVKGASSSGKSNLVRTVLRIFPPSATVERASLSPKAPVHGKEELGGKVLYIAEQRGGKDAQYLIRLLQSEGGIAHEFTTVNGRRRSTELAKRKGRPAVITTTTEDRVFEDDETRFLSVWVDQSGEQTRAILRAEVRPSHGINSEKFRTYRRAVEVLLKHKVSCRMPQWFETIAEHVPANVRSRRDWPRFLTLCKAVALCRVYSSGRETCSQIEIDLSDYATAYRLLNRVFSKSGSKMSPSTELCIGAAKRIYRETRRAATISEIRRVLNWEPGATYKHAKLAVKLGRLKYESAIRANNAKRLVPVDATGDDFLLSPKTVLQHHPELKRAEYVDPITGKLIRIRRKSK